MYRLKFIGEGGDGLIIGKPGTGKSHIAKAAAYQATLQGFDVRHVEAETEFARYALGSTAKQVALLPSFIEPDLIVLDDLFLAQGHLGGPPSADDRSSTHWPAYL